MRQDAQTEENETEQKATKQDPSGAPLRGINQRKQLCAHLLLPTVPGISDYLYHHRTGQNRRSSHHQAERYYHCQTIQEEKERKVKKMMRLKMGKGSSNKKKVCTMVYYRRLDGTSSLGHGGGPRKCELLHWHFGCVSGMLDLFSFRWCRQCRNQLNAVAESIIVVVYVLYEIISIESRWRNVYNHSFIHFSILFR